MADLVEIRNWCFIHVFPAFLVYHICINSCCRVPDILVCSVIECGRRYPPMTLPNITLRPYDILS